jgi:hypothetical protein
LVPWETGRLSPSPKKKESSLPGFGLECLRTHGCVWRAETHSGAKVRTPMGAQRDGEPSMLGTPLVAPAASYGRQPSQGGVKCAEGLPWRQHKRHERDMGRKCV